MAKDKDLLETVEGLLKLAQKYGASIEASGIKVTLSHPTRLNEEELLKNLNAPVMPSDDDMLLWSAGGELPSKALKDSGE